MNRPRRDGESFRQYRMSQDAEENSLKEYLKGRLIREAKPKPAKTRIKGIRRDKIESGVPQWMRRYSNRYASVRAR